MLHTRRETRPSGRLTSKEGVIATGNGDGPNGSCGPKRPWAYRECETVWRHPDMTASELSEMLPGRTPEAVKGFRKRWGRYRLTGVTPLCQKCGAHPVNVRDPEARRWGLCMECAIVEREYRDMHADELRRRNDARRQRKCNERKRKERK